MALIAINTSLTVTGGTLECLLSANAAGEVTVVLIHTSATLRRRRPVGIDEQGYDVWADVWTEPVVTITARAQGDDDIYALAADLGYHLPEFGWQDIAIGYSPREAGSRDE